MHDIGYKRKMLQHCAGGHKGYVQRDLDKRIDNAKYQYWQSRRVVYHPAKQMMLGEAILK